MMEGSLILIFICIAIVLGGASLRKMGSVPELVIFNFENLIN